MIVHLPLPFTFQTQVSEFGMERVIGDDVSLRIHAEQAEKVMLCFCIEMDSYLLLRVLSVKEG